MSGSEDLIKIKIPYFFINIQLSILIVRYSNSWADRFIWLFLGTHLCILFFIFILFRIFVYLV